MLIDCGGVADILCGVVDLWIQRCKLVHWRQECVGNCVGKDCKVRVGDWVDVTQE